MIKELLIYIVGLFIGSEIYSRISNQESKNLLELKEVEKAIQKMNGVLDLIIVFVYCFGLSPHLFDIVWLSVASNTNSQIPPIIGIKTIKNIHPLLPTSCNLLAKTDKLGIIVTKK